MNKTTDDRLDTTVIARLPAEIELTKRNSKNSLEVEIKTGKEMLGTLILGRGSVQWWPRGNKVNRSEMRWKQFAALLNGCLTSKQNEAA